MATTFSGEQEIEALYVGYFGRAGDPAGVNYWVQQLNNGLSITQIAASFAVQPEAKSLYSFLANPTNTTAGAITAFVTEVYQDLFNRSPDAGGLQYWTQQLVAANGNPSVIGQFIENVVTGAQGTDALSIQNKVTVAQDFTNSLTSANLPYNAGVNSIAHSIIAATTSDPSSVAAEETAVSNYISGQTTAPPTILPVTNLALTVSGDTVHLSHTTGASTVSLSGADLTAYPSSHFGTVAELVNAGITSVTDTSANFTLDASGNSSATTFNFGTGVVSGSDPVSSAGITYTGVTTYITSDNGDTVTVSAATQNVIASSDDNTINLGSLAYTGTLNFTAGSGGTDTVNATVGGNLSGATIDGTSSSVAKIALVLSAAGTETLSVAEYNTITSTTGGSITFTGGTFGTDTIAFSNGGAVTAISSVGNYDLSTAGDTITLNNVADNVTGAASGNDIINLAALAYTGTVAFGAAGSDSIHVTVGGNISGGAVTSGGATVALVLSGAGVETMNTAEYNLFNATSITGGTFGGDTITFSDTGTLTANANVGNYDLSTAGNIITLNNVADNVNGAASGSDTINLAALTYTGTVAFGAAGSDSIHVTVGGDISGGTITTGGATVGLVLSGAGTETMNTAEYNLFSATSISGGSPASNTIVFSDAGTVTDVATVGNYTLANFTNNFTVANNAADNVTGGTGNDTVAFGSITPTGTIALGAGTNHITATVGGDLSGATITAAGGTADLTLSAAGTETLSTAEYNLFNTTGIIFTGSTASGNTIAFSNAGTVQINSNVQNYTLVGSDTISLSTGTATVSIGGSGNSIINNGGTYTLTDTGSNNTFVLPLSGLGEDTINGPVLSNGATFDLRAAMAATTWDQQMSDLGSYLTIGTQSGNALVQISDTSGGTSHTVAVLVGQGSVSLSSFVAHALLT